jgi:hypothetical protein
MSSFVATGGQAIQVSGNYGLITPLASWSQATWFIDPQNVTGTASDSNTGLTSGTALRTWAQLINNLGTYSPLIAQVTTITFLSSHTDNTDPVIFHPYHTKGGYCIIRGNLGAAQQVATGTLASVTSKVRATPQLLQANIGASGAAGLMLVNSTHSARCWVYKNVSGNVWSLTQPLAPVTLPSVFPFPALVDTFANTDTYTLYKPTQVNIVDVACTLVDYNGASFNNMLYLHQLTVFDPQGIASDNVYRGNHIAMIECATQRGIFNNALVNDAEEATFNVYNVGGWFGGAQGTGAVDAIVGGCIAGAGSSCDVAGNVAFDGDFILAPGLGFAAPQGCSIGLMYLETGTTLILSGGKTGLIDLAGGYGTGVGGQTLWGPGGVSLFYNASLFYKPNFTASSIMLFTGAINMNRGTTASAYNTAVDPAVWHAGRTVNPGNLDASIAGGGFAGAAIVPGGASIIGSEG